MNFSKSFFWGGLTLILSGGGMYGLERFSAYLSQAIIISGYTSSGTTVGEIDGIRVSLNSNLLVLPFLIVGIILVVIGTVLGLMKRTKRMD